MDLREIPVTTINSEETTLKELAPGVALVVNVASRCGHTPQYAQLEEIHRQYSDRGFTVVGFPCNQFMAQEPGTAAEIKEFCSLNYDVTFPLMAKTKVNGKRKHPLFSMLREVRDGNGDNGRVKWNFEKFLIAPTGEVTRFRSDVQPDDPEIITAIEAALPS